jgi:hypothetical protein
MGTDSKAVALGLAKLADAVHHLREAQVDIEARMARAAPGSQDERLALGLARVLGHLSEAVADVTPEMWAMMISDRAVGLDDVRKALEAAA